MSRELGAASGDIVAALAAKKLADNQLYADAAIGWDCPRDGKTYLNDLRSMHDRMIDLWTSKVATEKTQTHEEILGFRYRRSLLNDIERFRAEDVPSLGRCQLQAVVSGDPADQWNDVPEHWATVKSSDPSDWSDLNYIEEAWLPVDGSNKMVELIRGETQIKTTKQSVAVASTSDGSPATSPVTPVVA